MEWKKENYSISTNKKKIDVDYVYQFLKQSYWAENIPLKIVRKAIQNSICFGLYHQNKQVGFARVITDKSTFAYLADVFIDPAYRGKGLSKWMMEIIVNYRHLKGLRRFMLATKDAHGLYEQFGFSLMPDTGRWMHIHDPDLYRKSH